MRPISICAAFAACAVAAFAAFPASAQLIDVNIFKNTSYQQTSAAAPTTPIGYFFDAGGDFTNPTDFTNAHLDYPVLQSQGLLIGGSGVFTSFGYGSPFVTDLATFNAQYPTGAYTFSLNNVFTMATASASISYGGDAYAAEVPALTPSTFAKLQGFRSWQGLTIDFNDFTPDAATTPGASATFFSIFDSSGKVVFTSGGLDPSTTSLFVPAGALRPGQAYSWELDFSDRINGMDGPVFTTQGFDVRTDGVFTTSVPEPATWGMLILGLFGTGALLRRRGTAALAA